MIVCAVGCAGAPPPSTPADRLATKTTVSRKNPGGDAVDAHNAAVNRLVNETIGYQRDKFNSLAVFLPDTRHWKRVRFYGYPTRVGFRYGDEHHAIALVDYKGPRPGIALTIAAVALLAGLVVGVVHVYALGRSGVAINQGQRTIRALHSYNAALEVWRQMAMVPDTAARHAALVTQRDSIADALRQELTALGDELRHPTDQSLVYDVLQELNQNRALGAEIGEGGRAAMIILMARPWWARSSPTCFTQSSIRGSDSNERNDSGNHT